MLTPYLTYGLLLFLVCQNTPATNTSLRPLDELVHRYMLSDDPTVRADVLKQIKQDQSYTPQRLTKAIGRVQLWSPLSLRDGKIVWIDRHGKEQATSYRIPADYDSTLSFPLILGDLPEWFGDADGFVLASLPSDMPSDFHQSPEAHSDLEAMLLTLRHSIHLDAQRTYLCAPANVGWLLLSTYPDIFAGAILHGPPLKLPYAAQLYPILLGNYQHIPIHWILPADQNDTSSLLAFYIQDLAHQKNIPLEFINRNRAKSNLKPSQWLASLTLPEASRPTSHWYRYPTQGRTPWLSAATYKGSPWTADQLSIVVNQTVNRDAYITEVLQNRLAYLEGQVLGQTIDIKTRRCGSLEWRLYEQSIDWSKPITVLCNGQRRFEGKIKPSVTTMLESARTSWNFSRPVWLNRKIAIRSDAPNS